MKVFVYVVVVVFVVNILQVKGDFATTQRSSATSKKPSATVKKPSGKNKRPQQKVLLISLDGFRWDFDSITKTPEVDDVKKNGVTSEFVLNVFPTKTLPNHHSIVTGLYPENHGMVDNTFLDKKTGKIYTDWDTTPSWWNQTVPIWIENQRQGHDSGMLFWPGYRVKYSEKGNSEMAAKYLPDKDYAADYEEKEGKKIKIMSLDDQIELAMKWLSKDNVTFLAMHNDEPDATAHNNGAEVDDKLKETISGVDKFVGTIKKKIKEEHLTDSVNVIFVGDHGHISTSSERQLYLDDIIDVKNDVISVMGFTNVFIYTKDDKTKSVFDKLNKASENDTRFHVFLKKDIPSYFHVKNSTRMSDILLLAQPGWVMIKSKKDRPYYLKGDWKRGEHGYDNVQRDMNPGFFAYGPMFRAGYKKSCIKSVDLYSLMCYILNINPHDNDGRFKRVKPLLKDFKDEKEDLTELYEQDDDPIKCV